MARLGFVDQEGNVSHISSSSSYTPVKKKKKKDEEVKVTVNDNKSSDIRTIKTEDTKKDKSIIEKAATVGKGVLSGLARGVTGIADTPMQGAREQLQKGEKNKTQEDMIKDAAVGMLRASSPLANALLKNKETSNAIKKTIKSKDKGTLEKIVNSGLIAVGNTPDNTYQGINAALRGSGALDNSLDEKVANFQEIIDKPSQNYQQKVAQEAQEIGGLTNTLTNVGQQIGNMAPSIATTAITKNPSAGLAVMGVSAKGQATNEALQSGADIETANRIGTGKGLTEVGTELATGGLKIFGKGALDDVAKGFIDKKVGKAGLNWLAKQGLGIAGEMGEEVVSDLVGTLIDKGTIDPNANYTPQDLLNTITSTGLTTLLLNGITGGYTPRAYRQNLVEMQESRGNNGNTNNNTNNVVPDTKQVREIVEQKNNGEIDAEEANNRLADVQNGTYQQNQNNEVVIQEAQRQFDAINQAEQSGQIDSQTANQERQAIINTMSQMQQVNQIDIVEPEYDDNLGPVAKAVDNVMYKAQGSPDETRSYVGIKKTPTYDEIVDKKLKQRSEYLNDTMSNLSKPQEQNNKAERVENQTIKVEQEKKISPLDVLTKSERQKYNKIREKQANKEPLSVKDKETLRSFQNKWNNYKEVQQRKEQGIKNPELNSNITKFEDVKSGYKYVKNFDESKFDSTMVNKAKDIVSANKQGRRTKEQWLDVAKNIGMQADNLDSKALEKLAFESWAYTSPNQKDTLNRQGAKNVPFGVQEWVKAVYEGARVGTKIETQEETPKAQETKTPKVEENKKTAQEVSLKYAKQYYKRNLGKYEPGDAFESAIGEYQLRPEEAENLRDYTINKYPDYADEINRRYNDLYNQEQETKEEPKAEQPKVEETKETIEEKPKQEIVKSDGSVVTAPIDTKGKNKLANIEINVNNDGGNNNNNNNGSNLTTQGDNNNRGKEAQILENYKDRKANKKQPFKERAAELMHSAVKGVFDSAEEIVRIGKYHNDAQLNPLYDMTLTANSTADFNIGGMKDSYQSNLSGEKIGESLENCWKPVEDAGLVRQMNAYLYEQHNIDRWNQFNDDGSRKYVFGPEHSDLVSKRNIAEMLEVHPELEELSKPILNYQKNLLKVLVEGGQVSQSHADHLNEIYKNYVPTWRDKDVQSNKTLKNSKGKIDINNPLKEATGSSEDLLPLKEVQAQMTKNVFKTSRTNLFGQQLYKDIGDLDKLKQIGMGELNKQYAENGKVDVLNQEQFLKEGEKYLDEYLKEFAPNNVPVDIKDGQKTMNVYFNGVKVAMPIDEGIETALKPLKPQNDLAKVLSKVNNFKRGVITQYNPGFSISNALKDAPDAMLNSKYGKEFPAEYAKTMKEMLDRGLSKGDQELFNQYCALGGLSNRTFDTFEGFKKDSTAKKVVGFVPSKISDVNDIIEQIPRFTEFKLSLKNGATLSEAMYNAADLTTNFKRGGTLTKALDAYGTTFLSASTGGFYKQIRNITQQPSGKAFLKFAAKGMALGLTPAIINSLLYSSPFGDDDDKEEAKNAYDKLRQYEKDDYLLWYKGDGKFIKIPKGRAVSIPAIMYNAVLNTTKGEKVNIKDVFTSVLNQIGPNNPLSDNAILSFSQIDLLNKKSQGKSWSGSPIESSYMQSLEPGLRYDSKTDEFSKWLGGKLNVSPKKINYVIQQNTGILGDLLLPAITPKTTGPNALARGTNFLTRRFTTDTVGSNTTTEKFYDKQTELTEIQNNPKKASDENAIRKNYMSLRAGEIAEKRKEIEEINSDKSLTKDEKYKKIRNLQKDINNISEDTLKKVEKVKKQGDYAATIGGNVYTKNDYGQWKKESEQAKAKRDSLGLNVEDYYYLKKEEAYTQPNGRKQSLVDGETAKEKIALVDAFGFDPSDYLEYSYNINNIKEGKNTKQKVFEYINSLDISQEQKIALMKKKYKTYRSYDNQLYNTINNADLTKEEKESVANFLKIGG